MANVAHPSNFVLSCTRLIGEKSYDFYEPFTIGTFVIYAWRLLIPLPLQKEKSHPDEYNERFGYTIYRNGELIDPTKEKPFCKLPSFKKYSHWFDTLLTKESFHATLNDVASIK